MLCRSFSIIDMRKDNKSGLVVEKPATKTHDIPLLFIHGMCHGAWCWQEYYLPYFAQKGYTSYALDLPAHGNHKADKKLRSLTLQDYASAVAGAIEAIGVTPVLIGHSMGGRVVQKYLENHKVPLAVLYASAPPKRMIGTALRFLFHRPGRFFRINLNRSLYPMVENPEICRELLFSYSLSEEKLIRYQKSMQEESYRAFLDMLMLDIAQPQKVSSPIVVLGASEDVLVTNENVRMTARTYHTKAEFFSGTGHDMMLDVNWQTVADRILERLHEYGI